MRRRALASDTSGKKQIRRPGTTIPHLCRQEVTPTASQQLWAQGPAPARRCDTEGRTRHQGREGENGDGNRDGGGDEREDESRMSTRVGIGARTGAGMGERTGTRVDMRVEGRQSLGIYKVVIKVGWKTR